MGEQSGYVLNVIEEKWNNRGTKMLKMKIWEEIFSIFSFKNLFFSTFFPLVSLATLISKIETVN